MRILLLQPWMGLDKTEPGPRLHPAGAELSVYHFSGRRLLYRRLAKWIAKEEGDPEFTPIPDMRAAKPQHNKQIKEALNR